MSVIDRLEDAYILYQNGRKEGALFSTIIAVAATSRKRYPKKKVKEDSKAFKMFISEELSKYGPGWKENTKVRFKFTDKPVKPVTVKINIRQLSSSKAKLKPSNAVDDLEKTTCRDVLYKYVRNELVHEARLPDCVDITDEDSLNITITNNNKITFTTGLILYLTKIVVEAPENSDLFENRDDHGLLYKRTETP